MLCDLKQNFIKAQCPICRRYGGEGGKKPPLHNPCSCVRQFQSDPRPHIPAGTEGRCPCLAHEQIIPCVILACTTEGV